MISDITGIDYKLLKDNIILETNELPISRQNEKAKKCDFIIRIDKNMIINLELNKESYSELLIKNLSYIFNIFSTLTKKGQKYNEDLNVVQININCFKDNLYEKNLPLIDFKLSNINNNQVLIDNLIIYMLNVVKCSEVYYNEAKEEIPKYIRWGALIYCTDISKIPSITKGILTKKECNLIMDKLNEITTEDLFMTKEEALEWADWTENTIYDKGVKIGITQGKIEGNQETSEEYIKSMVDNNIELDIISKITNKTIEEIKEIINKD